MGSAAAEPTLKDDFLALALAHYDGPRDPRPAWETDSGERLLAGRVPLRDLAALHGWALGRLAEERPGADPAAVIDAGAKVLGRLLSLYDADSRQRRDELGKAETELRQRETFLRTVIEAAPAAINIRDREGRYVLVNKLLAETFGSTPEEMLSTRFEDRYPAGYRDLEGADDNTRVFETGRPIYGLEGAYVVDGRKEVWLSSKAPIRNARGEVDFVTTVAIDITERVETEGERRRLERLLGDAIESLPHGFAVTDPKGRLHLCNAAFARFCGRPPEELPGLQGNQYLGDFARGLVRVDGEAFSATPAQVERLSRRLGAAQAPPVEVEFEGGAWHLLSRNPTSDGGAVLLCLDITSQKVAEEALRQSERYFQSIVEAHPLPVWMVDVDNGEILYESPAAARLLGLDWPAKETRSAVNYYARQSDRLLFLRQLRDKGEVHDLELQARKADGTVFWASLTSRLVPYQGRDVAITSISDLTERRALQRELARQREALHQSEKLSALGELLAGVAHELNNPLSVVVGQALLLTETAEDEKTKARAQKIGRAADRCARIVKSFLAMARQQPLDSRAMDVNESILAALDVTAYALRASGIEVSLDLADGLPPIWGDPDQIGQVMTNLIVNARHALEESAPPRRLRLASSYRRADGEVVIKVEDNGPGVPEAIRGRIFEPLFTTKDVSSGTGIGLTLCHRILDAHGGRIELEGGAGECSVFVVGLPAMRPDQGPSAAGAEAPSGALPLSVLVIDDEADVAEVLSDILETDGHEVEVANSGEAALSRLAQRHYDIVLSDLRMPGLDGPRLFEILEDERPELVSRTAFITGDSLSPGIQAFLDKVGRPFIEKPITPDEIRTLVRDLSGA